jgi:hypothetical protein
VNDEPIERPIRRRQRSDGAVPPVVIIAGVLVGLILFGLGTRWVATRMNEPKVSQAERIARQQEQAAKDRRAAQSTVPSTANRNGEWRVVEVTNIAGGLMTVRSQAALDAGKMLTCNFLHGGHCADEDPPGQNIPAQVHPIGDSFSSSSEAWTWLCRELKNKRVNRLAEGTLGEYNGKLTAVGDRNAGEACL